MHSKDIKRLKLLKGRIKSKIEQGEFYRTRVYHLEVGNLNDESKEK